MAKDFDPSEKSVEEVNRHLEKASDEERDRVLAAELAGKKRKTILEPAGIDPDERRDSSGRVLYPWEVSADEQVVAVAVDETDEERKAREAQAEQDQLVAAASDQGGVTPAGSGSAAGGIAGTGAGTTAPGTTAATTSAGAPGFTGGTTGTGNI